MTSLVRSVVVDFLKEKVNVNEEEDVIKYICEVLSDESLQFSAVVDGLASLLISLQVARNEAEAARVLRALGDKLAPPPSPKEEDEDDEEQEETSPKVSTKLSTWRRDDPYGECSKLTPEQVIAITKNPDPRVRRDALRNMCPCHVKSNVESLWIRIMEMVNDPDPAVRYQVLHNLCDGSPACREDDVIRTLEILHNDPDKKVRRRVHQVLTHYRHTGKWNIM